MNIETPQQLTASFQNAHLAPFLEEQLGEALVKQRFKTEKKRRSGWLKPARGEKEERIVSVEVLAVIYKELCAGSMTKPELAEKTGFVISTVGVGINQMQDLGWCKPCGKRAKATIYTRCKDHSDAVTPDFTKSCMTPMQAQTYAAISEDVSTTGDIARHLGWKRGAAYNALLNLESGRHVSKEIVQNGRKFDAVWSVGQ